jgi:phosphoribosylformylglycinamidine synthase
LESAYTNTFENLFPTVEKEKITVEIDEKSNSVNPRNIIIKKHGIAQPKVFAPVFPGTNCEYDTLNAFRKRGCGKQPAFNQYQSSIA